MDIDSPKCLLNSINKNKRDIYWQELSNINPNEINICSLDFEIESIEILDEEYNQRKFNYNKKRKISSSSLTSLNDTNEYSVFSKKLIIKD